MTEVAISTIENWPRDLSFPSDSDVDAVNEACYSALAFEYDSEAHATCRDFDKFTERFLKAVCNVLSVRNPPRYLDVGVGTGKSVLSFRQWLDERHSDVEVIDLSAQMLERANQKLGALVSRYHHTSIHSFEMRAPYNVVTATMADPFLTPTALKIMSSLLDDAGYLILTSPLPTWAVSTREVNLERCFFHDLDGRLLSAFSFCWDPLKLIDFLRQSDLELKLFATECLTELSVLSTISPLHENLLAKHSEIAYCAGYVFRKAAPR